MEILGAIFGILIIFVVVGGIVSLVIFLLPFLLGLVGIGIVVAAAFLVLFFVFQIIKATFSKKGSNRVIGTVTIV